ncbi:TonB-dependent receptor [Pusillimonas sp. ANT_WB101]|nr:TonB-dependent receptor [Pusillimonas sp. ANT_WB101]KAA0889605.1 TonB-dependent receptor [Pusillimonas sp. ANT_WB101]
MFCHQVTPQWVLGLNVNNVFGRTYYEKVGSVSNSNWYGAPRSWMLTLRGQL